MATNYSNNLDTLIKKSDEEWRDGLHLYKLRLREDKQDLANGIQKLVFHEPDPTKETKVLMLMGETGSGKSTLINMIANYLFDIKFESNERIILVDETALNNSQIKSQTKLITAYVFGYSSVKNFRSNLILVDTPGFNDTDGLNRDKMLTDQLSHLLSDDYEIDFVNMIGLVIKTANVKSNSTQKYIYNTFISMFSGDVKPNIFAFATFWDSTTDLCLKILQNLNIPYTKSFNFNNCSFLQTCNASSDNEMNIYFWNNSCQRIKEVLKTLDNTSPISFLFSKEVLLERKKLHDLLSYINGFIETVLNLLVKLDKEKSIICTLQNELDDTKDYEFEIEVPFTVAVSPPKADNAAVQNFFVDGVSFLVQTFVKNPKILGPIMGLVQIVGSLIQPANTPQDCEFRTEFKKEKMTIASMKNRYFDGENKLISKSQLIDELEKEISDYTKSLVDLFKQAQIHIEKLNMISFHKNTLSIENYIKRIITMEESKGNTNSQQKVKFLNEIIPLVREKDGYNPVTMTSDQLLKKLKELTLT